MHLGEEPGQQTIVRHRIKYARLSQQHHQHHRCQPAQRAEFHNEADPGQVHPVNGNSQRGGNIQLFIVHDTGQHQRIQNVEHGADEQRTDNSDGHVTLGIARFLCRG